jgi:mannitol-1-phosphate 5-dehydrogenase
MQQAIVFGAGNIGRGFIGQLFSQSGYHVTFIDVDPLMVETLAHDGAYTVAEVSNAGTTEHRIGPVTAVSGRDAATAAAAVAAADVGATAVGVRALPAIAGVLAAGIAQRAERDAAPLDIIVCENQKDADAMLRQAVAEALPAAHAAYLDRAVGFVEPVIGRMVPVPSAASREADPGYIRVEPYCELPVDGAGFRGPVPAIRGLTAHDHFDRFVARKLYIHNCGHAVLGYLGFLYGHAFGWQALDDRRIATVLRQAWEESATGIVHTYGADRSWLDAHMTDLDERFRNRALGDVNARLARDPLRKLRPGDRLVQPALMAMDAGMLPHGLATGIAAALCFNDPEDPTAVQLQAQLAADGVGTTLAELTGIAADSELGQTISSAYDALLRCRVR